MVFITEQGVADIRGLTPSKRARVIIEKCAHPDYRPLLREYLEYAEKHCPGHIPLDLSKAFDMQERFLKTGSML